MTSTYERLYNTTSTPYPAWLLSTSLISTGLLTPSKQLVPIKNSATAEGIQQFQTVIKKQYPSKISALTFGSALALGGYIIYDGDLNNGCGFNFAWSTLYLIVNGRKSVKSLRLWPVALTGLALGNSFFYGMRFIWPNREDKEVI